RAAARGALGQEELFPGVGPAMLRTRILRTLLYKEALRYRYNWGLLVMVFALLALAGLISVSARFGKLPGQENQDIPLCVIAYPKDDPRSAACAESLKGVPPPPGGRVVVYQALYTLADGFRQLPSA